MGKQQDRAGQWESRWTKMQCLLHVTVAAGHETPAERGFLPNELRHLVVLCGMNCWLCAYHEKYNKKWDSQ